MPSWNGRGYVSLVGLLEMLGTVLYSCGVYVYVKGSLVSTRAPSRREPIYLGPACLTLAGAPL